MRIRPVVLLLILAASPALAADLELELPKITFVLRQGELPLAQREGQVLPREYDTVQKLWPQLVDKKADQVLAALKARYRSLTEYLEAGDPKGEAKRLAVPGGLSAESRADGVSATLLYFIGMTYVEVKNDVAAEAAFNAALAALPDYVRVHESLGILYLLTERNREAMAHLTRALQLGLNTPNLFGALGYLNARQQNYFGAVGAYQMALMLEPDSVQWQEGLLAALRMSKQPAAGLALADQLLNARPDDAELWVYRASLELDAGQRQRSLNSLEVAIRLGDNSLANLQVCAALHMELGSVERAVTLLRAGWGKGLEFRFVAESMQALVVREEWAALQKLLDEFKNPADLSEVQQSVLLLMRASLSRHNNDLARAKAELQQAVTLDPANGEALLTLGQLLHDEKSYTQAELLFERAAAEGPVAERATLLLAQVAIDQHDYVKALKLLRDVHEADPDRTDLARNIETLESLVKLQPGN